MRKRLVIGNWKLHGSLSENAQLVQGLNTDLKVLSSENQPQVAICPPFVYLSSLAQQLESTPLSLGAQDVFEQEKGAFTGEVSASMLAEFNVKYVLVGHSERRTLFGDTDQRVAAKFDAVKKQGLIPVLCIGETLQQRESNRTQDVIITQLQSVVDVVGAEALATSVIAYEPIWAIGTGKTATTQQAQQVHALIRNWLTERVGEKALTTQILYGGSVKPDNAAELFNQPDIDGGLIGGASLEAESFLAICNS